MFMESTPEIPLRFEIGQEDVLHTCKKKDINNFQLW